VAQEMLLVRLKGRLRSPEELCEGDFEHSGGATTQEDRLAGCSSLLEMVNPSETLGASPWAESTSHWVTLKTRLADS
jgi:hypothetical protein